MVNFLRIEDGVAVEAITLPADIEPASIFPADFVKACVPAGSASVGWVVGSRGKLVAPVEVSASAQQLLDYAAAKRYAIEISGIKVKIGEESAVPMSTKREDRDGARDTLIAIMAGLRQNGAYFKFADGAPRPATNDEMKTAIATAFSHVQSAYDLEAAVIDRIKSVKSSISDYADVDAAFLPPPLVG